VPELNGKLYGLIKRRFLKFKIYLNYSRRKNVLTDYNPKVNNIITKFTQKYNADITKSFGRNSHIKDLTHF